MINSIVDIAMLGMLVSTALLMMRSQSPLTVTILSAIYSLIMCTLFVVLDAVDVAFTEAAVGAGISTILILAVIKAKDESNQKPRWPSAMSIVMGLLVGGLLILGTLDMPIYGDPEAAIHHHLAPRFLGQSADEVGIPNVVTSVLASYRGYDTLGEVVVIFTAGIAVLLLLAGPGDGVSRNGENNPNQLINNPILRFVLLRIIPLVILFALYVQFHGDYGPGGGFQAGVIFGAGLITFGLLAGSESLKTVISEKWVTMGMAIGVLLYGCVGLAGLFMGGEFLNYSVLASTQTAGQHLGILLIELGVGITVAFTMVSFYISFNNDQG